MSAARALYRRILRAARTWPDPKEAADIRAEARTLFEANRAVADADTITAKLREGEERLALGQHYGICYPRHYHVDKDSWQDATKQSRASYMSSYYADTANSDATSSQQQKSQQAAHSHFRHDGKRR